MMRFQSRVFTLAKDPEHPEQNQDACCLDAARGIATIADGVAAGIFSRQWAGILTESVVADTPDPRDRAAFARWLAERRRSWSQRIDPSRLAWHQKAKLREGAFSTLLWVELRPRQENYSGPQDSWRLRAYAVGDSCLWHVRGETTLRVFPVEKAEQFEVNPVVMGSVDLGRDDQITFESYEATCQPGDLLVLCTDAIAAWALRLMQSGQPPRWEQYWDMPRRVWQEEIHRLRDEGHMRYDDATLVLLRVTDGTAPLESNWPAEEEAAAQPPPASDFSAWKEKLKSVSERMAEQVTEQASRSWETIKRWVSSAETAIRRRQTKSPDDTGGKEQ